MLVDGEMADQQLYGLDTPVAPFGFAEAARRVQPDDVVVFPEANLQRYIEASATWVCRKAVTNQNAFYAIRNRIPGGYRQAGVEFAIANSRFVSDVTASYLGLAPERVFLVPHWIVRGPFVPAEVDGEKRRLAVCYMPRKLPDIVRRVREAVQETEPDVPWVEIDGMPENEVARCFKTNAILFSSQDQEGCPLPALEAMACNCIIAGFRGTANFPHPYATGENGFWAADRSVSEGVAKVLDAIRTVREKSAEFEKARAAGRSTVRAFSHAAVSAALSEMVDVVTQQSYAERQISPAPLDWKSRAGVRRLMLGDSYADWLARTRAKLSRILRGPSGAREERVV
ncbi:MAG TPA: glycosyltransferase [Pirellulales bacterium]|nr:glycosyltransferase [Pirellulales bacterium]